jgi:hypothetical protein
MIQSAERNRVRRRLAEERERRQKQDGESGDVPMPHWGPNYTYHLSKHDRSYAKNILTALTDDPLTSVEVAKLSGVSRHKCAVMLPILAQLRLCRVEFSKGFPYYLKEESTMKYLAGVDPFPLVVPQDVVNQEAQAIEQAAHVLDEAQERIQEKITDRTLSVKEAIGDRPESKFRSDGTIKIDKGIPIPERQDRRGRGYKYPFQYMEVGDSFLFPDNKPSNKTTVYSIAFAWNKKYAPRQMAVRKTEEGYRCWRIK